jgi:AcrR family transcriptional regulator
VNKDPAPASPAGGLGARAVERALDARARDAAAEVERILNAALNVIQRVEPASPRVSDILSEAGSSNQAFYGYFAGKDDLILAVMDRGVAILRSYVEHQMSKESDPTLRIAHWIAAILAQADDPLLSKQSRAVGRLVDGIRGPRAVEAGSFRVSLVEPLLAALHDAGAGEPAACADAIHDVTFGALKRHVQSLSAVPVGEREYLIRFCLSGAGLSIAFDLTRVLSRRPRPPS